MMRELALVTVVAACGSAAAAAAAPQACEHPRADLGIQYRFVGGEFRSGDGGAWVHYFTEPTVVAVAPDGPAAGILQPGDAIVAVNDRLITTAEGSRSFQFSADGATMTVRVRRRGEMHSLDLLPKSDCGAAAEDPAPAAASAGGRPGSAMGDAWLGVHLRCENCGITSDLTWHFQTPPVVTEIQPGSAAEAAGVRVGDAIVRIDGLELTTRDGATRFSRIGVGDTVELILDRSGELRTVRLVATARPR